MVAEKGERGDKAARFVAREGVTCEPKKNFGSSRP
jgi:hypothetical protein